MKKIKSTAYANFSIFGLSFIFIFGTIIILTNCILESDLHYTIIRCISRKARDKVRYHRLEWYTNGTLQLQRLAHEQTGFGKWSRCDEEIPVTEAGDQLSPLDLDDPKHPKLQRAPPLSLNTRLFSNVTEAREATFSRQRLDSNNTIVVYSPGTTTTGMPLPIRINSDIDMVARSPTLSKKESKEKRGTEIRRVPLEPPDHPSSHPQHQKHQNKPKSWFRPRPPS